MSTRDRRPEHGGMRNPAAGGTPRKTKKRLSGKRKAFLIILAGILLSVAVFLSPLFSITTIRIDPVSFYTEEELSAAFQEYLHKNGFVSLLKDTSFSHLDDLFRRRFGSREKELLFDFPLFKNISVTYELPHTLTVKIEERTPIMVLESHGIYLYTDAEGYLLGAYTQENKPDLPVLRGIDVQDYKIGTSIAGGKNRTVDEAIKICTVMKQLSMLSYIDIIDISDYNNIWMYCAPSLSVKFGGAEDIGRKLSYLKGIIDSGHDGTSNGTLDMSAGGNPIFKSNESAGNGDDTQTPEPER